MTPERLRAAADTYERLAVEVLRPIGDPILWDLPYADRVAALLRATADAHDHGRCSCGPLTVHGIELDIAVDIRCDAAGDLADTILEEPTP